MKKLLIIGISFFAVVSCKAMRKRNKGLAVKNGCCCFDDNKKIILKQF